MGEPISTPWPCTRLSQYPLDSDWNDNFPLSRLSGIDYTNTTAAVHSFFLTSPLADVYSELRDYAWQQGAYSNANSLDKEFFSHILSHDYPFMIGNKGYEIQTAFKIDASKYKGMDHLRASHFDLYQVERAGMGFAELHSLLHPGLIRAYVSISESPKPGDYLFVRLLPVGWLPRAFAYSAVEPWDTVSPDHIGGILDICRRQYGGFREKFPGTDERAFMKVAAYHVYELIQAFELIDRLNHILESVEDSVESVTVSIIFPDRGKMPKPAECPHAKPVREGGADLVDLATAPLVDNKNIPETLREVIISSEGRTLEMTTFMRKYGAAYVDHFIESLPSRTKIIRKTRKLDHSEVYRALRHLYIVN